MLPDPTATEIARWVLAALDRYGLDTLPFATAQEQLSPRADAFDRFSLDDRDTARFYATLALDRNLFEAFAILASVRHLQHLRPPPGLVDRVRASRALRSGEPSRSESCVPAEVTIYPEASDTNLLLHLLWLIADTEPRTTRADAVALAQPFALKFPASGDPQPSPTARAALLGPCSLCVTLEPPIHPNLTGQATQLMAGRDVLAAFDLAPTGASLSIDLSAVPEASREFVRLLDPIPAETGIALPRVIGVALALHAGQL